MKFRYLAYSAQEGVHKGLLEASDEVEARLQLVRRALKPLTIEPARRRLKLEELFPSLSSVGSGELIRFFRQLATMVGSGASLQRTLDILHGETRNRSMRNVIGEIRTAVAEGISLSEAMARHPRVFDPLFVSAVRVGEFTGRLAPSIEQLADLKEKEKEQRQRLFRTMMMPAINLLAAGLMLTVMVTAVLPPIVESTKRMGADVPLMMRVAIGATNGARDNLIVILLSVTVAGVILTLLWRRASVRNGFDQLKVRLPVFGPLIVSGELSRFSSTVGLLLESGVPLATALQLGTNGCANAAVRKGFTDAEDSLLSGHTLADGLKRHSFLPHMWVELVTIGEQSNSLARTMRDLGTTYQKRVDNQLGTIVSVLDPVSTLVVGALVGFLALSNFQLVQSAMNTVAP